MREKEDGSHTHFYPPYLITPSESKVDSADRIAPFK